jgi:hypothetical protein
MRDVILFAFVAGLHFLTSVCLLIYTFGGGMARFDSGAPAGLAETLAGWLLALLSVPLLTVLERLSQRRFLGLLGLHSVCSQRLSLGYSGSRRASMLA